MPDIAAFRGIRYDLGHVGSLADVTAPPYDVIDGIQQDALYKRHPANCVRLILNRDEPGDDEYSNRYSRAARFLRNWLREGVLFRESDPAVYVYHQTFSNGEEGTGKADAESLTRRGFIARVRLEPLGEGQIHPHEETHAGAKEDRLRLWKQCRANLSSIFGMYPDEENAAQELLETTVRGQTPIDVTDDDGTLHRVWPVTDVAIISALTGRMGGRPIYIADGHHRYETALAYRDQLAALSPEHPANFVLMTCVSMSDPGMIVLPTHRLFRGLAPMTTGELAERLGDCFEMEKWVVGSGQWAGSDPQADDWSSKKPADDLSSQAGPSPDTASVSPSVAADFWSQIELEDDQGTIGFYTAKDGAWSTARITDAGRRRLAQVAPDRSHAWQSLGVAILHRLVIDTLLEGRNLPTPKYVRSLDDLTHGLTHGDDAGRDATGQKGTGGQFELAALVMPVGLDHIRAVSAEGERMPAKSTFFYPKLLSGLVINPLE